MDQQQQQQQPMEMAGPLVVPLDTAAAVNRDNDTDTTDDNTRRTMTATILRQKPRIRTNTSTSTNYTNCSSKLKKKKKWPPQFRSRLRTGHEGYYYYYDDDDDDEEENVCCVNNNINNNNTFVEASSSSSPFSRFSSRSRRLLFLFVLIGGFIVGAAFFAATVTITSNAPMTMTTGSWFTNTSGGNKRHHHHHPSSLSYRYNTSTATATATATVRGATSMMMAKNVIATETNPNHNNKNATYGIGGSTSSSSSSYYSSPWYWSWSYVNKFRFMCEESSSSLLSQFFLLFSSSPATQSESSSQQRRRELSGSRASGPSSSSSSSTGSSSTSSSSSSTGSSLSLKGTSKNEAQLVIAGKMSVDNALCNIAQYNLKTKEWSLSERIQLSLYNSYSGGEVYSLLANHTSRMISMSNIDPTNNQYQRNNNNDNDKINNNDGSGELIVVGAFDTTYRNSQVTYCSVGKWDGYQLSKVGEGLCNSALSKGMKITTAAMAGPQDVYVAGSFQTQVWNGDRHEFVKIFNIAHYNAAGPEGPVWLPLNIGQITCSWCTVTVLALAWDSKRRQLHVAGKFNAIGGANVPAGLAIYDLATERLVAHPGGGLAMRNTTEDGVGTALQLDEEKGVLYVMGSFERLTALPSELCYGLAAYDINSNIWTCLDDSAHTVQPTGGGNMLLTPYGLMVAGKISGEATTWEDDSRPYTIALLHTTLKETPKVVESNTTSSSSSSITTATIATTGKKVYLPSSSESASASASNGSSSSSKNSGSSSIKTSNIKNSNNNSTQQLLQPKNESYHEFVWTWLPGFSGNDEPLHALANGFGDHEGAVFIAGDNLVAKWSYQERKRTVMTTTTSKIGASMSSAHEHEHSGGGGRHLLSSSDSSSTATTEWVAVTENLSTDHVSGAIMAISQMQLAPDPEPDDINIRPDPEPNSTSLNIRILVTLTVGCLIGILGAVICNRQLTSKIFPCFGFDFRDDGIPLDTLQIGHTNITDAYQRAMKTRYVEQPQFLTIIDPQEIFLQRIIGEGTFGRVWSARWNSSSVAVKEFVFAQAAVIGKSSMQQEIVEEIIGEAGMMAILRHPNVLQLFGCSLTAQAIWIVSELCSLGSLRQLLDDRERSLPDDLRVNLALQVAEGMSYLHNQDPAIIHRDLKSHNIFVHETFVNTEQPDDSNINGPSGDGQSNKLTRWLRPQKMETHSTLVAKIGDWGSARATMSGSRTMTHGVGTACWLAPEVIKYARSSKYSDVYGYGIILWEMSSREEVYQGLESTQIIAKVANEGLRPPVPQDCPWKDVMVKCWDENPRDRLEFNEVVVELNRISKELDDAGDNDGDIDNDNDNKDFEDGSSIDRQEQPQKRDLEDSAEETPLIKNHQIRITTRDDDQNDGKTRNLFSNILRQRRGE